MGPGTDVQHHTPVSFLVQPEHILLIDQLAADNQANEGDKTTRDESHPSLMQRTSPCLRLTAQSEESLRSLKLPSAASPI